MKNNTQVLYEQKCKQKEETILSLRYNVALEISLDIFLSQSLGCRKAILKSV